MLIETSQQGQPMTTHIPVFSDADGIMRIIILLFSYVIDGQEETVVETLYTVVLLGRKWPNI